MSPGRLHICRLLFRWLPETRCFGLKVGCLRWAGARVDQGVRICSSITVLGTGSLEIGQGSWIGHQAFLVSGSQIHIGASVDIGPRVFIGTGTHEIDAAGAHSAGKGVNRDVVINDGVWIGACSTILPGVTVGNKAVVAAGAVVVDDVPERVIVAGVPAKIIRRLE